jgi:hypothetical protein
MVAKTPALDAGIDEFQRLRRLIPERPDFHLSNWGDWRRGYFGVRGHSSHSTCLENMGGCASPDASDHVYERELGWWAEVSDAIISEMSITHRIAISNVYEASVWTFNRGNLEDVLIEAARLFWVQAMRRDLQ